VPVQLKINNLADFHELVKAHGYPGEMLIPRDLWEFLASRMDLRIAAGEDSKGKFIWFEGTKVRPSARQEKGTLVDLENAEWVNSEYKFYAEQTSKS